MNESKQLIQQIIEGIQEKKGKKIDWVDLTHIHEAICNHFIICQGESPTQVSAIVDSIKEFARKHVHSMIWNIYGKMQNSLKYLIWTK